MQSVQLLSRALLVAVFVVSVIGKVRSRNAFAGFVETLVAFNLPTQLATAPFAASMVGLEIACSALLFIRPLAGLALALLLLCGFTVGIARVLARGEKTACRCFGADDHPVDGSYLWRNGVLVGVAIAGLLCGGSPRLPLIQSSEAIWAGSGLALGLLLTRWSDFAFLFGKEARS